MCTTIAILLVFCRKKVARFFGNWLEKRGERYKQVMARWEQIDAIRVKWADGNASKYLFPEFAVKHGVTLEELREYHKHRPIFPEIEERWDTE